jgi:AcrR family transcriptional regulator
MVIRKRLLDAAQVLFSELGYGPTTFSELASEAGVGRTTIYEYFSDKDDLLASLVEEELPAVLSEMLSQLPPGGSVADRLAALARELIRFVATDPILGLLLHRDVAALNDDSKRRIEVAHLELIHEFISLLRTGVQAGELSEMPLDLMGRFVQDLIMSGAQVLIDAEDPTARMEEVTDTIVAMLFRGISA